MKNNDKGIQEIKNRIEKYARKVVSKTVGTIRDELTQEAFNAIVKFYESYKPKFYQRHYYNFLEQSFRKYYKNPHNSIYYGGVELTPELLMDYYQDDTKEVFDTVYSGFHGPAGMIGAGWNSIGENPIAFSRVPDRMIPTPYQLISQKRDDIVKHFQEYLDNAKNQVTKQGVKL